MLKHSLIAGLALAVPVLTFAPRGAEVHTNFVPIAHAADAPALTDAELAGKAWDVLNKHCVSCHGEGKKNYRAAPIDKGTHAKLIEKKQVVPGKPDESELYTYMIDPDDPMPPKKVVVRPTAEEIATIKTWIEKGAPAWSTEAKPADKPADAPAEKPADTPAAN